MKKSNKTYAQQAKAIMSKYKKRLGENFERYDKLAVEAMNKELAELMEKQEMQKQAQTEAMYQDQMAMGGEVRGSIIPMDAGLPGPEFIPRMPDGGGVPYFGDYPPVYTLPEVNINAYGYRHGIGNYPPSTNLPEFEVTAPNQIRGLGAYPPATNLPEVTITGQRPITGIGKYPPTDAVVPGAAPQYAGQSYGRTSMPQTTTIPTSTVGVPNGVAPTTRTATTTRTTKATPYQYPAGYPTVISDGPIGPFDQFTMQRQPATATTFKSQPIVGGGNMTTNAGALTAKQALAQQGIDKGSSGFFSSIPTEALIGMGAQALGSIGSALLTKKPKATKLPYVNMPDYVPVNSDEAMRAAELAYQDAQGSLRSASPSQYMGGISKLMSDRAAATAGIAERTENANAQGMNAYKMARAQMEQQRAMQQASLDEAHNRDMLIYNNQIAGIPTELAGVVAGGMRDTLAYKSQQDALQWMGSQNYRVVDLGNGKTTRAVIGNMKNGTGSYKKGNKTIYFTGGDPNNIITDVNEYKRLLNEK